uniref:Transposase Tnp1/En/Spm-like domain-containing protein n=1 Tax=Oryza brachyantha TaxID=4533 RepID=J3N806_ORYBR
MAGEKMASSQVTGKSARLTQYEVERDEQVARNKEIMRALNIGRIVKELNGLQGASSSNPSKKRTKTTHTTSEAVLAGPVLRPRPRRDDIDNEQEMMFRILVMIPSMTLKSKYEVDQGVLNFVMATAAKKWRDFKGDLKKNLFDPTLSDEELIARRDERVNDDDWEWLISFWRSEKSKTRSKIGQQNHAQQSQPHTFGSMSFACVAHEKSSSTQPCLGEEEHDHYIEVGREVILYSTIAPAAPVAKATIISTDPTTIVGGESLGQQYYEVAVNVVIKRDVVLPHPYDGVEIMADALYLSIAWPFTKVSQDIGNTAKVLLKLSATDLWKTTIFGQSFVNLPMFCYICPFVEELISYSYI